WQVRGVPGVEGGHDGLERRIAGRDALGVDRRDRRPVGVLHRVDPQTRTTPARAGAGRGTADGIRTRVTGVRGQRPRPLDERGTYPGRPSFYRIARAAHSTKNFPVSPSEYQREVTVVLRV